MNLPNNIVLQEEDAKTATCRAQQVDRLQKLAVKRELLQRRKLPVVVLRPAPQEIGG